MGCGCNKKTNNKELINRAQKKNSATDKKTSITTTKLPLVSTGKPTVTNTNPPRAKK